MPAISIPKLYALLMPKLGKEPTEALIESFALKEEVTSARAELKEDLKEKVEQESKYLATKEDIIRLEARLGARLDKDIAGVKIAIAHTKLDLIKWMIGLLVAFSSLVIAAIQFMLK